MAVLPAPLPTTVAGKEQVAAMKEIAEIMFPNLKWEGIVKNLNSSSRCVTKAALNMLNDIKLVEACHRYKIDFLLTTNSSHFMKYGRQKKLEIVGIKVRNPNAKFQTELEALVSIGQG